MKTNKLLISLLTLGVIATGTYAFASKVYADNESKYPPMVQRFIDKFGLDTNEVDAIMGEMQAERQGNRNNNMEERLNEAVEEGKMTYEQKAALQAKFEEMHSERESMQALTQEERRAIMGEHRNEMEQWAKDNGIDTSLMFGSRKGMGRGMNF